MSAGLSLRLIGTSDLHANIFAYDYYRDKPDDTVGLAKTAALAASARAEVANALLFDNGDIIQGSPLGDYAALAMGLKKGEIHPMIAAMNEMGYAACALGNHEFNYGLDFLEIALAGANFPALSCNILRPDGSFYYKPWVILEPTLRDEAGAEQRLRIGVIGFTPPQIAQWDQTHLSGRATTVGIAEAARVHIPALRARRVDLVVALCHSGVSRKPPRPGEENAALALAAVGGIDAMFLGHQHLLLPGEDFAGIDGVDVANGRPARARPPSCPASGAAISASSILPSSAPAQAGGSPPPRSKRGRSTSARATRSARWSRRRRRARRGASRARGDARLCPLAGRRHRFADQFLFRAGRGRSVGANRQRRADLVR